MKKLLGMALIAAALLSACDGTSEVREVEVTRIVEVPVEVEVIREVEVPVEVVVEVPVEVFVEVTPEASAIPQNFVFLEYTGQGEGGVITDNFQWPACDKAVFVAEKSARDNFIIRVVNVDTDDEMGLFNLLDENRAEALQPLLGGTYYLNVKSSPSGDWIITGECRD